mmetsp:Transcript_14557/g.25910  ORF Transcript_14557/g.25910 Transcript_14557/m.25910 type:complete len:397 (+) Transcript_14557:3658-4848(+)
MHEGAEVSRFQGEVGVEGAHVRCHRGEEQMDRGGVASGEVQRTDVADPLQVGRGARLGIDGVVDHIPGDIAADAGRGDRDCLSAIRPASGVEGVGHPGRLTRDGAVRQLDADGREICDDCYEWPVHNWFNVWGLPAEVDRSLTSDVPSRGEANVDHSVRNGIDGDTAQVAGEGKPLEWAVGRQRTVGPLHSGTTGQLARDLQVVGLWHDRGCVGLHGVGHSADHPRAGGRRRDGGDQEEAAHHRDVGHEGRIHEVLSHVGDAKWAWTKESPERGVEHVQKAAELEMRWAVEHGEVTDVLRTLLGAPVGGLVCGRHPPAHTIGRIDVCGGEDQALGCLGHAGRDRRDGNHHGNTALDNEIEGRGEGCGGAHIDDGCVWVRSEVDRFEGEVVAQRTTG